jgi:hypothetical protein
MQTKGIALMTKEQRKNFKPCYVIEIKKLFSGKAQKITTYYRNDIITKISYSEPYILKIS